MSKDSVFMTLPVNVNELLNILKNKNMTEKGRTNKDLQILSNKYKNSTKGTCSICLDDDIDLLLYHCHNHKYCLSCSVILDIKPCPICRI